MSVCSVGHVYNEKRELTRVTVNKYLSVSEGGVEWETIRHGYKSLSNFI